MFFRGTGAGIGTASGVINIGTATVSKTDSGTWVISNAGNTWGSTSIVNGTLQNGVTNAFPVTTVVSMGQAASTATWSLSTFSQTVAGITTIAADTSVTTITGTGGTLTVNNGSTPYIYGGTTNTTGIIAGTLNLVFEGTGGTAGQPRATGGVITLTGADTYTGTTTINSGATLQLGNQASNSQILVTGTTITDSGILVFAPGTTNITYANVINGAGNMTLNGATAGTPAGIDLTATTGTFSGTYTINQGRIEVTAQTNLGNAADVITVTGSSGGLPAGSSGLTPP